LPENPSAAELDPFRISGEEIHGFLLEAFRLGNQIRYKFMKGLQAMDEGLYYKLYASSDVAQYAQKFFGCSNTLTADLIRVAGKLEELPLCLAAFESGELCWSSLLFITRVAKPGTEKAWLDFARGRSSHDVKREVQAAVAAGCDAPRKNPYGLPGVKLRMGLQFTPEQHDLVEKALRKVAGEIKGPLGGQKPSPEAALLFVAQRIIETDCLLSDRVEKKGPLSTILYRHCPACRISHVVTKDGPMEVPPEVIERAEAEADKVVISPEEELGPEARGTVPKAERDKPNTPALTRRVLLRDNGVCANTYCSHRAGLNAHHVIWRSKGGKTEIWNEISLCRGCHTLVHAGLLRITSTELGEVKFEPRADKRPLDLAALREKVVKAPVVEVVVPASGDGLVPRRLGPVPAGSHGAPASAGAPAAPAAGQASGRTSQGPELEPLVWALRNLGHRADAARERVHEAAEHFERLGQTPKAEQILKRALMRRDARDKMDAREAAKAASAKTA
jgi:hypothetical protein